MKTITLTINEVGEITQEQEDLYMSEWLDLWYEQYGDPKWTLEEIEQQRIHLIEECEIWNWISAEIASSIQFDTRPDVSEDAFRWALTEMLDDIRNI